MTGRKKRWNWRRTVLVLAAIVFAALYLPFRHFFIPSGSEIPALLIGDHVLVGRLSYGLSAGSLGWPGLSSWRVMPVQPARGDIAVFKSTKNPSVDFIKRVIGLPGDRIQMKQGRLFINGVMLEREAEGTVSMKDVFGSQVDMPTYMETLPNGVKHVIVEIKGDDGYYDNTDEYLVPPDNYFMMGDNRDNSDDSRDLNEIGYVPFDNFVGRAEIVLYSVRDDESVFQFWRWPWSLRADRFFRFVR